MLEHAEMIEDNFDLFIPNDLNMTDPAKRKETGEAIKKFYMKGKSISKDTKQEIINVNYRDLVPTLSFSNGTEYFMFLINYCRFSVTLCLVTDQPSRRRS